MDQNKQTDRTQKNKAGKSANLSITLRRFFREVQQSRILSEAKKRRFFSKDITRKEKRTIARRKAWVKSLKRGY